MNSWYGGMRDKVSTLSLHFDLVMPAPDDKARNIKTSEGPIKPATSTSSHLVLQLTHLLAQPMNPSEPQSISSVSYDALNLFRYTMPVDFPRMLSTSIPIPADGNHLPPSAPIVDMGLQCPPLVHLGTSTSPSPQIFDPTVSFINTPFTGYPTTGIISVLNPTSHTG